MKAKVLFSILGLCAWSFCGTPSAQASSVARPDSLIVISEQELIDGLRAIAEAAAKEQKVQRSGKDGLTAEDMRLLKYQMLLNALGLGAVDMQHPVQVQHTHTTAECAVCAANRRGGAAASRYDDERLERLERAIDLLLSQHLAKDPRASVLIRSKEKKDTVAKVVPMMPLQPAEQKPDPRIGELQRKIDELLSLKDELTKPKINTVVEMRTDTILKPIGFKRQVFFAQGSSRLSTAARKSLGDVVLMMSRDHSLVMRLTGFASPEGSKALNQRLSDQRSRAVREFLIASGIEEHRLITVAAGVDATQDLRTVARRVDIELARREVHRH